MNFRTSLLATIAALVSSTVGAYALPISGSYALTVASITADTVDLSQASRINFTPTSNTISTFTPFGFTPTLTACTTGNCGTITNITGIPAGSALTPFSPISPLFTVQGVSFSLNSLTTVLRSSGPNGSSLELRGTGVYSAAGYENTAGSFDITAQNGSLTIMADSASASGNVFATSVPEPASLALLGASLATIGMIRRRKQG